MNEMNLIGLKQADNPATGRSAMRSTLANYLQSSRDIAPKVVDSPDTNALNITHAIADEKGESLAENLVAIQNGGGDEMGKSDKFFWIFPSWR